MSRQRLSPRLGLESGIVRLVPYDRAWPTLFAAESARLRAAVADARLGALVLEHTGSTAVPGLCAKPILDILAGAPEGASLGPYIDPLERAGYLHRGPQGIPGREFFRRGEPRAYHVHLTTVGSSFWRDHLLFRNFLRRHADVRDEYARLKQSLAARYPRDREAYIDGKGSFVCEVLRMARSERE